MKDNWKQKKQASTLPTLFLTCIAEKENCTELRERLKNVWMFPEIGEEQLIHERFEPLMDFGESRYHELIRLLYELHVHVRDDSRVDWYIDNREYMI
ncbi:hypothetical protein [Youngiibacter fragilis]|uniref:Uncharacterized protein n=1 Tax=Youngiibacter fragilis 232.1 TaxID=994573 RepID=V7IAV3_9CLOT|nr:hypothetical protein [Youngiibacter fragilis]ETA82436.1 hypothetical protein T472_0201005 [Youngiibacter fragilis 232.1]